MDDIFTSTIPDQVKLDDLVGEGKKYGSADEVAKALAHANKFIEQLKTEKQQAVEDLTTRATVEDAIKRLQAKPDANGGTGLQTVTTPVQNQSSEEKKAITLEDIDRFLEDKERKKVEVTNLGTVQGAILKYTGSSEKARDFLVNKATELGTSVERLADLGKESPTALLKVLGINDTVKDASITPMTKTTGVTTQAPKKALDSGATWSDDEITELRRTNPSKYFSPDVQNKIMRDKMERLKKQKNI